eukprot:SAG31_NODE_1179_length_9530_cov_8.153748_2_plen_152_part_00
MAGCELMLCQLHSHAPLRAQRCGPTRLCQRIATCQRILRTRLSAAPDSRWASRPIAVWTVPKPPSSRSRTGRRGTSVTLRKKRTTSSGQPGVSRMFLSPDAYFDGCRKVNRLAHLGNYTQCYKCWKKYSTWSEADELGKPTYWVHQRDVEF